jgi:indolepyruvate ferredoxin oxidoreductase alpha subunit
LDHSAAGKLDFEELCGACGVENVHVVDMGKGADELPARVAEALAKDELSVIITRRPCLIAARKIREYEQVNQSSQ